MVHSVTQFYAKNQHIHKIRHEDVEGAKRTEKTIGSYQKIPKYT